jgi:hypothetical protein
MWSARWHGGRGGVPGGAGSPRLPPPEQVAVGAFRGRVAAASCVPGEVDALEALEKVFAKLRQILVREKPDVEYFSVDLRVASATPIPRS